MDSINERFEKKTKYDDHKQSKREGFTFIGEGMKLDGCTVLVGDSIIEYWPPEFFYRYEFATGTRVVNRGIGGDTSDRMLERLSENVTALSPKNVAILIGTNDFGLGAPVEFPYCNIERAINLLKSTLPDVNIVLMSVLPVNSKVQLISCVGKRDNDLIDELNVKLERLAASYGVTYYDANRLLKDKKGRLDKAYTYDGLHPNAQGYAQISDGLIELFR